MPLYNARGDILGGVDRTVWKQPRHFPIETVAANANFGVWLTDDSQGWQANAFSGTPHVVTSTGQDYPWGAAPLRGGGGELWAYLDNPIRLIHPVHPPLLGAGKHWVGRDGTLTYSPDRQAARGGFAWRTREGHTTVVANVPVGWTFCLDRTCMAYGDGGSSFWFVDGEHSPEHYTLLAAVPAGLKLARYQGKVWAVYDAGVAHPIDNPEAAWRFGQTDRTNNPDALELDGRLHICWSTTTGERPADLRSQSFTGEPPVVIPSFPPTDQAIGIGIFDDPVGPRIIDVSEAVTPNVRAVFWQIGTNGQSQSKALAKSLNVGALAYKDGYGLTPTQVPSGFRALVFAYPKPDRDVPYSLGRVDETLEILTRAGISCDLAVATYCQWNGETYDLAEQKVLDTLAGMWRLGVFYKVGAIWCYTRRKPIAGPVILDGLEKWPNLQTAVNRMKAASGDWQHFPPYHQPVEFFEPLGAL